jgi:hypothetical protein
MISKSQPARSGTPQIQSIIITAITLFAFSGLMVGFTVGALVRPAKPSTNNTNQTNVVSTTPTPTPRPTPTVPPTTHLTFPDLKLSGPTLNPDGTQTYSVSIQAKDKAAPTKPLNDITCRIWLVPAQDANVKEDLSKDTDQLQHTDTFNQPFPHEIENALILDPTTPNQTQLCQQGSAQWKFTLSPAVDKGSYFLVGLTDWQGKSWNWSWNTITVNSKKPGA